MNEASKDLLKLRTFYHPAYLHREYFYTQRLRGTVQQYVWNKTQIVIMTLGRLRHLLHTGLASQEDANDFFKVNTNNYGVLKKDDVINLHHLYNAYFLDSHEIGMHLFLLFHSKYGTKYISKQTHVPEEAISQIRHNKSSYLKLPTDKILSLENFYLNSKLEKHAVKERQTQILIEEG